MTPELARTKLAAFLLDPPQRPLILGREHERATATLIQALSGLAAIPEPARNAGRLASAADRPSFPSHTPTIDFARDPALTHPLSGASLTMRPLVTSVDPDAVSRVVLEAARALAAAAGDDPVRRYLAVWRWLPDWIRATESGDPRLGTLWEWLPADARVPDHSVWDRMSVMAAVAGAADDPAFLIVAIGPVQGFIAQARSTRDLWSGSYLLAWLAWHAIRAVAEAVGPDAVLYPSLRGQPLVDAWLQERGVSPPSATAPIPPAARRVAPFPNKLLALVPAHQGPSIAEAALQAARAAWRRLGGEIADLLASAAGAAWRPEAWDGQLDRQIETAWACLPWPAAGDETAWLDVAGRLLGPIGLAGFERSLSVYQERGRFQVNPGSYYAPAHGLAQRAFDARKLTRAFEPAAEPGFKCTLCGVRAPSIGGRDSYRDQRTAWQRLARALRDPSLLDPEGNERLCAVCLAKRVAPRAPSISAATGEQAPSFPSTSSVATLPFRRAVLAGLATHRSLAEPVTRFGTALRRLDRHAAELGATVLLGRPPFPELGRLLTSDSEDPRAAADPLLRVDGEWLLAETSARRRAALERAGNSSDARSALDDAVRCLAELTAAARTVGVRPPSSYYAILLLDGDRMGRWVSGDQHRVTLGELLHPRIRDGLERDPDWREALAERRLFAPSTHAAIGAILHDFGLWVVPEVVERRHGGRVVYAGGDDVLALLPGDHALAAVDDLRRAYRAPFLARDDAGQLLDAVAERAPASMTIFRGMGPDATASAGLLFVHHLLPLDLALAEARRLEHRAKESGRDALAIGVARRSGPDPELELVSRFERDGVSVRHLAEDARRLLRVDATDGNPPDAPRGAASAPAAGRLPYRLRELAPVLDSLPDPDGRRAAVLAVASRHTHDDAGRERLRALHDALSADIPTADGVMIAPREAVAELARLLRLARFLEAEI